MTHLGCQDCSFHFSLAVHVCLPGSNSYFPLEASFKRGGCGNARASECECGASECGSASGGEAARRPSGPAPARPYPAHPPHQRLESAGGLFSKQNKKRGRVSKPRWSGQQRARADGKLRATYLALGQAQDGYHDDGRSGHCQHGTRHHRVVAPSSEQQKRR